MSTKIYNAYIYEGTIQELLQDLKLMRKWFQEYLLKKVADHETSKDILDHIYTKLEGRKARNRWTKYRYEKEYQVRSMIIRNVHDVLPDDFDLVSSAIIYPQLKGKILLQLFIHDQIFLQLFPLNDRFKDYHYQNQSDRPDDISAGEWKKRKKDWDVIFDDATVPAQAGLIFEFLDWNFCCQLSRAIVKNGEVNNANS